MKYLYSIILILGLSTNIFAQQGAVTNAILYHKDGQLEHARTEIDKAVKHEKTKDSPEAWYYRGMIYESIANTDKDQYKNLSPEAASEAYLSYNKSIDLDLKKGKFSKMSESKIPNLFPGLINKGYAEYEKGDFEKALNNFELASKVKPDDTTGYVYAIYAAEELKDYESITRNISALKRIDYSSTFLYYQQIYIALNIEKDTTKALEIATQGVKDFPKSSILVEQQTNLLIISGKKEEAIKNLKQLHEMNPSDVITLSQLGVLYDNLGEKDKALDSYQKALKIQPDNYVANFNTAVIYYQKAIGEKEQLRNSDTKDKSGKNQEIQGLFGESLKRAQTALIKAEDAEDKKNIQILINELNKELK